MDDGELYGTNREDFDPVEDIAVMPYSSGTTGTEHLLCHLAAYLILL